MIGRALRLRCPHCGERGVLQSWFTIRAACPHCGVSLVVSNSVGANLLNLVTAEFILMIGLGTVVVRSAPDIPWTLLQFGAPLLMIVAPLLLYPFSKMLFVAFDLSLYPEGRPDARVHGVK